MKDFTLRHMNMCSRPNKEHTTNNAKGRCKEISQKEESYSPRSWRVATLKYATMFVFILQINLVSLVFPLNSRAALYIHIDEATPESVAMLKIT